MSRHVNVSQNEFEKELELSAMRELWRYMADPPLILSVRSALKAVKFSIATSASQIDGLRCVSVRKKNGVCWLDRLMESEISLIFQRWFSVPGFIP